MGRDAIITPETRHFSTLACIEDTPHILMAKVGRSIVGTMIYRIGTSDVQQGEAVFIILVILVFFFFFT